MKDGQVRVIFVKMATIFSARDPLPSIFDTITGNNL